MPFIPWVLVVQTAHLSGLLICGQNIIEPWGNVIAFICCGNTIIIGSPTYNKNAFFVNGFGCGIFLRASQSIWILSKSFSKLLKFVTKTKLFWAWLERDISSHIELPLNSPQEKKNEEKLKQPISVMPQSCDRSCTFSNWACEAEKASSIPYNTPAVLSWMNHEWEIWPLARYTKLKNEDM